MEHDRLYFWDYIGSKGTKNLLGEIQTNFNMGLSIDGSKDTCKVECFSFDYDSPIKPYSVVLHENTNTWWIVSKDKVERLPNESGFLYKHSIQLEGAIELLNARDLTDCGFYQNMYTIDEFTKRLFNLSTFEFGGNISINYGNNIDPNKVVDYIKSFENYTLLSALREFFDGYNLAVKLSFGETSEKLSSAILTIVSKTGNADFTPLSMEANMNDVKGIANMSKGSYGNSVVSNAENVTFTKSKIYPNLGYARLGSEDFYIKPENGNVVFRLPSRVNSVEWVEIAPNTMKIGILIHYGSAQDDRFTKEFDLSDQVDYANAIDYARYELTHNTTGVDPAIWDRLQERINSLFNDAYWNALASNDTREKALQENALRFYDTNEYDPIKNEFISDKPINIFHSGLNYTHGHDKPWVLANKSIRDGVQEPESVMYWERGSNLIKGFNFFKWHETLVDNKQVETQDTFGYELMRFDWSVTGNDNDGIVQVFVSHELSVPMGILYQKNKMVLSALNSMLRCKYMPMSNIKIKYDNSATGNDSKLYNQNGKYTDITALSRSILSYKNEIESDTITRYAVGYDIDEMPKVGEIYIKGNTPYIVGNASYDFNQNEECYFITAEYTLSKKIAVKTALTNPNTNIRDYGIPQKYNVARKQLYRDFYELSKTLDQNQDISYYLTLDKVVNLTHLPSSLESHTALIKCQYDHACGGGGSAYDGSVVQPRTEWCFQVDSIVTYLKKSVCEVIDFQDNNTIGYDSQNITCGFDIRRIFEMVVVGTANIDAVNTPITYTDEKGKVMGITLSMMNNTKLKKVWDAYKEEYEQIHGTIYDKSLYNRCVFIPTELFDMSVSGADYLITDFSYKKDPIEVPVFEYCCQVDDTDDVIIGEEILTQREDDYVYLYEAILVPKGKVNNNNWLLYFESSNVQKYMQYITINNANKTDRKIAKLELASPTLMSLSLYDSVNINTENLTKTENNLVNISNFLDEDSDLMIVRYIVPKDYIVSNSYITNVKYDLMMILRNPSTFVIVPIINVLAMTVNHYKLK